MAGPRGIRWGDLPPNYFNTHFPRSYYEDDPAFRDGPEDDEPPPPEEEQHRA